MPNPNPPRRMRAIVPEALPPGVDRLPSGAYRLRYVDAQVGRRTITARSLEDLEAKRRGPILAPGDDRLTVADYLRTWSDNRRGDVRANSWRTDAETLTRDVIPYLGERLRLVELAPEHVDAMLAAHRARPTRTGRPLSARSLAIIRGTLRKALADTVGIRIPTNPAVERLTAAQRRMRQAAAPRVGVDIAVPSRAVLRRLELHLRTVSPDGALHPLVVLAAATGMRQSELLALRWSALTADCSGLVVRETLQRDTRAFDRPKNASSGRPVVLPEPIAAILRMRRSTQRLERLAAGPRWSKDPAEAELVFTDPRGHALRGRQVTRRLQRELERAGLPAYDWKALRHAYVTGSLEDGHDIAVVSRSVGHSDITVTANAYTHYTERMRDAIASSAAERVLGNG